jgi:hypothetical protein
MSRRVRLGILLTVMVSLAAVSLWLNPPDWLDRPSAEDLVGKWLPENPQAATVSFCRSGECELSWPPEGKDAAPATATGTWELQGRRLVINLDSGSEVWHVRIWGNALTCQRGLDKPEQFRLRRAPPEPGRSFDVLSVPSFVGSSRGLRRTVVVPTLGTRLPAGKSAVWCAALALAWQQLGKDLGNGPVELEGAGDLGRALGSLPDVGLQPEDRYVAAGLAREGIQERISREMAARFPGAAVPDLGVAGPDDFLAYAYLQASVRYEFAFKDSDKPLEFRDSQGRVTPVKAFGIRRRDEYQGNNTFRGQVRVLFQEGEDFGLDLSKGTQPYELALARMQRKATLRETLADFEGRVARAAHKGTAPDLGDGAVLLVPNMDWRIEHRFEDMQGKRMLHPALPPGSFLKEACQLMRFKMDRRGAVLVAQATIVVADGAELQDFRFDRPYLLLLRRRGLPTPFFVMWVDNPELLQPR